MSWSVMSADLRAAMIRCAERGYRLVPVHSGMKFKNISGGDFYQVIDERGAVVLQAHTVEHVMRWLDEPKG